METTNKSQAERIKDALNALNEDITSNDKSACLDECNISQPTLWRYLNGKFSDLDKAIEILAFFNKQKTKREKALVKAVA